MDSDAYEDKIAELKDQLAEAREEIAVLRRAVMDHETEASHLKSAIASVADDLKRLTK